MSRRSSGTSKSDLQQLLKMLGARLLLAQRQDKRQTETQEPFFKIKKSFKKKKEKKFSNMTDAFFLFLRFSVVAVTFIQLSVAI